MKNSILVLHFKNYQKQSLKNVTIEDSLAELAFHAFIVVVPFVLFVSLRFKLFAYNSLTNSTQSELFNLK